MNLIDPGFALAHDITPNPRGAKHIPVHPYPLCPVADAKRQLPTDRSDFTRDDDSGV